MQTAQSKNGMIALIRRKLTQPVPGLGFLDAALPMPSFLNGGRMKRSRAQKRVAKRQPRREETTAEKDRSKGAQFSVEGPIVPGKETRYSIDGVDFTVGADTWIFGDLKLGAHARVRGPVQFNGERHATHIVIVKESTQEMHSA